jgi:hypothetical protein
MKKLSTILATGTIALIMSTPVLAGSVGTPGSYVPAQADSDTIAKLEQASEDAQRVAREGNKNNLAYARKSYQIDQLVARMKSGQPVSQKKIDRALRPVTVW